MKFTDGYWRTRNGFDVSYAAEIDEVATNGSSLRLLAPAHPVQQRGDTLKGPLLTLEVRAPAEGVIAVTVTHLAGSATRSPAFDVAGGDVGVVTDHGDRIELVSGDLSLVAHRGAPFALEVRRSGRLVTRFGHRSVAAVAAPDGSHHLLGQLDLGVGEHVYGLGERFTPFVKNGQVVESWNADGGTSSEQAYKAVPFYLSDAGYGVLVNHPGRVSFEVGSETVTRVQASVEDHVLELLVVDGPEPADVLRRYTALVGRPALPPPWSFGLWLTTSFTTDYDEETVTGFVRGMADRDIPLSVFHFDCFWMRPWRWCDFEWDPAVFPDPAGMLKRLKADHGLRICVWINPYIAQQSPLFAKGAAGGYLLHRTDGRVWQTDTWQPGMAIVDFTNPAAREWYAGHLRRLLAQGVDAFKTDFGERIPVDGVAWHDGGDPARMHNYYAHLYNRTVFDLLEEERGAGEAVLFARSATAGGQQMPVHWGGDSSATFPSMAESLRGGLSLSLSGFGFWSHDIGGFEGTPDPAVFKRWIAFGLLSSHSRLHGNESYRVPWLVDDESVDVLRTFTRLKARLMPYLFGAAVEANTTGLPMMRPMVLAFPDDPACAPLDRQYLLGPDLLVAPVFSADGDVRYYVPAGCWASLLTGEAVEGPGWRTERHAFDSLPLLVRPDAVIAMGTTDDRPDYDYADGTVLVVSAPADGSAHDSLLHAHDGSEAARLSTRRNGDLLTVAGDDRVHGWSVLLLGVHDATVVDGGRATPGRLGTTVVPEPGAAAVRVRLAGG